MLCPNPAAVSIKGESLLSGVDGLEIGKNPSLPGNVDLGVATAKHSLRIGC